MLISRGRQGVGEINNFKPHSQNGPFKIPLVILLPRASIYKQIYRCNKLNNSDSGKIHSKGRKGRERLNGAKLFLQKETFVQL